MYQLENVLIAEDGTLRLCDFGSTSTHRGPVADKRDRVDQEDIIQRFTTPVYRCSPRAGHAPLAFMTCILFLVQGARDG